MERVDYIVVGMGLAGSAVVAHLTFRDKKVVVFDTADGNTSSVVAAGLFNPITGNRMTTTWLAGPIFSYLHKYYPEIEKRTHRQFFHPTRLYRPFLNAGEQNEWMGADVTSEFAAFIDAVERSPIQDEWIANPMGGLMVRGGGYLNTVGYINAVRQMILEKGTLRDEPFDSSIVKVQDQVVTYKDIEAQRIIFCEGERNVNNPFFRWIPVNPLKGETITVDAEFAGDFVLNRGVYVVPKGNGWTVGATYEHPPFERGTTGEARKELVHKLKQIVKCEFRVVDQSFGIRPTSPDRRPMAGTHPNYKNVHFFNGMGTKGISLTPYFSRQLVEYLENGIGLDKAVDISRYYSLYWNSR